jgi:hypothetical protein
VPYRSLVQTWHDFYIVAGTASATLVGLLFVSLSLHLRAVLARPEVRGLARATLTNFGIVLLVALILVIPQDSHGTGLELQAIGASSILIIARPVFAASRSRTRTIPIWLLVMRFALSVLGYAGAVSAGVLLTTGDYGAGFASLAAATILLLIISLRNTWDLLVSVGEAIVDPESRGISS